MAPKAKAERRRLLAVNRARPDPTDLPAYLRLTEALSRGGQLGDLVIPPPPRTEAELLVLLRGAKDLGCTRVRVEPSGALLFEFS